MTVDIGHVLQSGLDAAQRWEAVPPDSRDAAEAAETATGALVLINAYLERGGALPVTWAAARPPGPGP